MDGTLLIDLLEAWTFKHNEKYNMHGALLKYNELRKTVDAV